MKYHHPSNIYFYKCPVCSSGRGTKCHRDDGQRGRAHLERRHLARSWRKENRTDRGDEYHSYISSDVWRGIRSRVLERDEHKCSVTGCTDKDLHVHHKKYPSAFGTEPLGWLVTVCGNHHGQIHARVREESLDLDTATRVVLGDVVETPKPKYVVVPPKRKKPTKKKRVTQPGRRCSSCFNTYDRSYPFVRCSCGRLLPMQ